MQREFSRNQRMSSLILRTLNKIIRIDVDDPSLHEITLTSIDLSHDLSIAKVYFSSLDLNGDIDCLLYTSPSPRDYAASRMPSSA